MDTVSALFGQYTPVACLCAVILVAITYQKLSGGKGKKPREHYGILTGPEEKNSTRIIHNSRCVGKPLVDGQEGSVNICDVFSESRKKFPNKNCLGSRPLVKIVKEEKEIKGVKKTWEYRQLGPYQWETYEEVGKRLDNFGSGLVHLGLKSGDNLGIYSETRVEWTIAANACFTQNIVVLTVYANLGLEQIIHAFNEGEISTIVTNAELLEGLVPGLKKVHALKRIIYTDEVKENVRKLYDGSTVQLIPFADVEKLGSENSIPRNPAKSRDELAVIMYTSGTTGMPKGVMLTHKNVIATMTGAFQVLNVTNNEVHLSYLPLAHILAFIIEIGMIAKGANIGYGNPRSLSTSSVRNCLGDLEELKPTLFAGVPSVHDKIKQGIQEKIKRSSPIVQGLFKYAYNVKKKAISEGKTTPLFNKLVFDKFKTALGGRVRLIISGGAPLSPQCCEFLSVCFDCPVCQGYGLTETCGGSLVREEDSQDISSKSCGAPIPCCEAKLVDIPEMNYTHKDHPLPRGEIWLRGHSVAPGYYKNPQKTHEEWTEDHWFKTGDIGLLQKDGTISIIDRKKNLVKPPHGEYIAPEKLESVFKNSPFVDNIMVYASSNHNELIAFVAPNKNTLQDFASKKGLHGIDWHDFCSRKEAESAVLESLGHIWKNEQLKSMERISAVKLFPEEWTPENGWLTAAMKLRRNEIHKEHAETIEKIYSKLETN